MRRDRSRSSYHFRVRSVQASELTRRLVLHPWPSSTKRDGIDAVEHLPYSLHDCVTCDAPVNRFMRCTDFSCMTLLWHRRCGITLLFLLQLTLIQALTPEQSEQSLKR
ncbi:hypothetical protein PHSY_004985 [Pseudozyma hubeiensis SY62]|uniref:Uncharacterized protein n=1 Tax=Pseudozyma hubeiensis (strain SY62) TaxID=1305764 RepID=R9PH44_PSEHS|nr:hypothetical protein PHSY_004985 [Pseudozyma hubeiensis SY62]GAC97400.1 hypothetical protein PHSY_004985 [Pseudozyma hubeiensis SY62]